MAAILAVWGRTDLPKSYLQPFRDVRKQLGQDNLARWLSASLALANATLHNLKREIKRHVLDLSRFSEAELHLGFACLGWMIAMTFFHHSPYFPGCRPRWCFMENQTKVLSLGRGSPAGTWLGQHRPGCQRGHPCHG